MSTLYNVEPQPTAKVLLQTTAGDILLELFAKQIPLASRNFLQLCLDGYYDGTIFHRLVPKFVLQGGDPTGTGHGGESSFDGESFADEYHSRLKFNRRGLLGMANTGQKDDNGSQFFLTLAETPELQGKNTMFGRVVGDTIYNVMKMGEADLAEGDGDRPLYPQKITGTEILVNPFTDMVKRDRVAQRTTEEKKEKKKPKRKAGKAILSFGGDEGEDSIELPVTKKPKYNAKLVTAGEEPVASKNTVSSEGADIATRFKTQEKPTPKSKPPRSPTPPPKLDSVPVKPPKPSQQKSPSPSLSRSTSPESTKQSALDRTKAQIAAVKASMKRDTISKPEASKKKSALEEMIPVNATRGRKRRPGGATAENSEDKRALALLQAFKSKLDSAPVEDPASTNMAGVSTSTPDAETNGIAPEADTAADDEAHLCDLHFIANCQSCKTWDEQAPDETKDDDDTGWMSHALTFKKDRLGKNLEWKRKNEEELVVIDPREKARELKVEKKVRDSRDERFERKGAR